MTIATTTLTTYRGSVAVFDFEAGVNITGWTLTFTAAERRGRERQHESTRLFAASRMKLITVPATIVDGPTGAYQVALTADDTRDLVSGRLRI